MRMFVALQLMQDKKYCVSYLIVVRLSKGNRSHSVSTTWEISFVLTPKSAPTRSASACRLRRPLVRSRRHSPRYARQTHREDRRPARWRNKFLVRHAACLG